MAQNPRNECPNPYAATSTTGTVVAYSAGSGTLTQATGLTGSWVRSTGFRVQKTTAAGNIYVTLPATSANTKDGQTWSTIVQWSVSAVPSGGVTIATVALDASSAILTYLGTTTITPTAGTVYQTVTKGVMPANTQRVASFINSGSIANGATLTTTACRLDDVDDASLAYGDGGTSGWYWTGSSGTSTSYQPLAKTGNDTGSTSESWLDSTSFSTTVPSPAQSFTRWDYRTAGQQLTSSTYSSADSGENYYTITSSPTTAPYSQVQNGRLEPVYPGTITSGQNQAIYHMQQITTPGSRFPTIGAWITMPSSSTNAAFNMAMIDQYPGFNASTFNAPCHMNFYQTGWDYSVISNGTGNYVTIGSGTYSPAVAWDNVTYKQVEVSISGNTATILLPNGVTTTVTDSRIGSLPAHVAWWEMGRFNGASAATAALGVRQFYASPAVTYANPLGKDSFTFTDSSLLDPNGGGNKLGTDSGLMNESSALFARSSTSDIATSSEARSGATSATANDLYAHSDQSNVLVSGQASDIGSLVESNSIFQGMLFNSTDLATLTESWNLSVIQSTSDSATQSEARSGSPALFANKTDLSSLIETIQQNLLASEIASFSDLVQPRFNYLWSADSFTALDVQRGNFQFSGNELFLFIEQCHIVEIQLKTEDPFVYPAYKHSNDLRVIAQDHFTREIVHWDLPVDNVKLVFNLTGPNLFSGVLTSEMESITTLSPALIPNRTWLHVEENNEIIASFIMTPFIDDTQTQSRQIEGEGFSSYPHWIVYQGKSFVGIQVDPARMIEKLWAHIQSYEDGNLNVLLSSISTPRRIGLPNTSLDYHTVTGQEIGVNNPGPYTLNYWSVTNCGEEIERLCKESSIEFLERSYWNSYHTDVVHLIDFGYPRVGTRRTDLKFREGENLYQLVPSYQESQENYASEVYIIGAGTGPGSIRSVKTGRIGRLRRTKVVQNQEITRQEQADTIARFEFTRISESRFLIESVTVDLTHDNAKFGSFQCGDDIYIQCNVPYTGFVQRWYRIMSYEYDIYNKIAVLQLDPSELFDYASQIIDPALYMPTSGFAICSEIKFLNSVVNAANPGQVPVTGNVDLIDDPLAVNIAQLIANQCFAFNEGTLAPGYALGYRKQGTQVSPITIKLEDLGEENILIIGKTPEGTLFFGDAVFFVTPTGNWYGERPPKTVEDSLNPVIVPAAKQYAEGVLNAYKTDPKSVTPGLKFPNWQNYGTAYSAYNTARIYYGWGGTYSSEGPGYEVQTIMGGLIAGSIYVY